MKKIVVIVASSMTIINAAHAFDFTILNETDGDVKVHIEYAPQACEFDEFTIEKNSSYDVTLGSCHITKIAIIAIGGKAFERMATSSKGFAYGTIILESKQGFDPTLNRVQIFNKTDGSLQANLTPHENSGKGS
jgi:hypothetical protein